MSGQHFDEIVMSVCKTKHTSISAFCRFAGISWTTYTTLRRKGLSQDQRVLMMNYVRKFLVAVA